jgi:hypothetical protein
MMKRSRFSADLSPRDSVSDASIYKWKAKRRGLDVAQAKRLKTLARQAKAGDRHPSAYDYAFCPQ